MGESGAREKEKVETDKQTNTQAGTQAGRQIHKQRDRHSKRDTETGRQRKGDRPSTHCRWR